MLLAAGCHKAPFKHRRQLLCAAQRGARRAARRLYWGTFVPLQLMLARARRLHWGTFVPPRLMLARARRLYWGTFVPLRLMLYPGLLVKFWLVLDGFPLYERLLVVACQFLLCCFNVGTAPPAARSPGAPAAAAAPELHAAACSAGVRALSARLCLRPCAARLQLCPLSTGGSLTQLHALSARVHSANVSGTQHTVLS